MVDNNTPTEDEIDARNVRTREARKQGNDYVEIIDPDAAQPEPTPVTAQGPQEVTVRMHPEHSVAVVQSGGESFVYDYGSDPQVIRYDSDLGDRPVTVELTDGQVPEGLSTQGMDNATVLAGIRAVRANPDYVAPEPSTPLPPGAQARLDAHVAGAARAGHGIGGGPADGAQVRPDPFAPEIGGPNNQNPDPFDGNGPVVMSPVQTQPQAAQPPAEAPQAETAAPAEPVTAQSLLDTITNNLADTQPPAIFDPATGINLSSVVLSGDHSISAVTRDTLVHAVENDLDVQRDRDGNYVLSNGAVLHGSDIETLVEVGNLDPDPQPSAPVVQTVTPAPVVESTPDALPSPAELLETLRVNMADPQPDPLHDIRADGSRGVNLNPIVMNDGSEVSRTTLAALENAVESDRLVTNDSGDYYLSVSDSRIVNKDVGNLNAMPDNQAPQADIDHSVAPEPDAVVPAVQSVAPTAPPELIAAATAPSAPPPPAQAEPAVSAPPRVAAVRSTDPAALQQMVGADGQSNFLEAWDFNGDGEMSMGEIFQGFLGMLGIDMGGQSPGFGLTPEPTVAMANNGPVAPDDNGAQRVNPQTGGHIVVNVAETQQNQQAPVSPEQNPSMGMGA